MEGPAKKPTWTARLEPPVDNLSLNMAWHGRRDVKTPSEATRRLVLEHLQDNVVIVSPQHGLTDEMAEGLRSRDFVSKDGDRDCFMFGYSAQGTIPETGMRLETGVFHRVEKEKWPQPFAVLLDPFDTETFVVLHRESFNVSGHTHWLSSCFHFRIKRDKDWKGADEYNALLGNELLGGVLFPEAGCSNPSNVYFSAGMLLHCIKSKNNGESSMMAHSVLSRQSSPLLIRGDWTLLGKWLLFTNHRDDKPPLKLYSLNLWDVVQGLALVHQHGEVPDRQTLFHLDVSAFCERKKIEAAHLGWK